MPLAIDEVNINTDTWRTLVESVNDIIDGLNSVVVTANGVEANGNVLVSGSITGGSVLVGLTPVALSTITVSAGTGLTGGGSLAANRTISLNSGTLSSLAKADSAVQPGALANVATSGSYNDLSNKPSLGSAAAANTADFATAAQGTKADAAVLTTTQTLNSTQKGQARANIDLSYDDLPWLSVPIGGIVALPTNITGVTEPPTNSSLFRYAKLTAGINGSGQYNDGITTSESVSGSAPLVLATAIVALSTSPIYNQTIRLLNTEGRFIRPGISAGTVVNDQMQLLTGDINMDFTNYTGTPAGVFAGTSSGTGNSRASGASSGMTLRFDSSNSTGARTGTETAPKHVQMTYYMRVL